MKIIFLDVDGVLNTSQTFIDIHNEKSKRVEIDEFRVKTLSELVNKTGAKIVLSSSWRIFWDDNLIPLNRKAEEFNKIFDKYGLTIYSKTPYIKGYRETEIDEWLNVHNNIENFVVIDDESFDLQKYVGTKLIKTSKVKNGKMLKNMDDCTGLCKHHIELAENILNK